MATVVTPVTYGARGDGVTDDTAAFQAALDYAKANNRSLFIPAPSVAYMVSNLTLDYSGDSQATSGPPYGFQAPSIIGEGRRRTIIRQISGSTGPVLSVTGRQGSFGAANNGKVSGFTLEGVEIIGTSGSSNHGVVVRNFVSCSIRDFHIRGCGGSGLKLVRDYFVSGDEEYGHGLSVRDGFIVACGRYGIESSATAWAGAGTGTGAAAVSLEAMTVECSANTLGGFYFSPANMNLFGCRAFQNGGAGFKTFRNPNQDSSNFTFNMWGCRSEGNCTSSGSYEIEVEGAVSGGGLYGCTVLATNARAPHCVGVGNAAAGSDSYIQRFVIESGFFSGEGTDASQMFCVTGSDCRGLVLVNPRIAYETFAAPGTVPSALMTDGGVNTTITDTATGGWSPFGYFRFMRELGVLGAPESNTAHLYIQDDGSGKTQLVVRFATGAEQVLATEP